MSANSVAAESDTIPSKKKITGDKQHKLANSTGIPVIFNISFAFI